MAFPFGARRGGVSTVLQNEVQECGLACLAMVANAHGHRVDLGYMRALHPVSGRGMTMAEIYGLAGGFGLDARGVGVSNVSDLDALKLPAILHWEGVHFVVLERAARGRFVVHDPAVGRRVFDAADMARSFSGVALEFEPRASIERIAAGTRVRLLDILRSFDGFWPAFAKVLVVSLAVSLLALATPVLLQIALDVVLPQADLDLLAVLAIGLAVLLVFDAAGRWLRDMVILRAALAMQLQFSRSLITHGFRLPLGYFEARHPGDIVTRLESVEEVKEFAANGLVRSLADGVMSLTSVVLMFYYSVPLTMAVLATLAAVLVVRAAFFGRTQRFTAESLVAKGDEKATLIDGLNQVAGLKAHNTVSAFGGRWFENLLRFAGQDFLSRRAQIDAHLLVQLAVVLGTVATLYMGVAAVIANQLTIGMLYAFFALRSSFFETADTLSVNLMQMSVLDAHVQRLGDLIREAPEEGLGAPAILRRINTGVRFSDIAIRFPGTAEPILSGADFALDVANGERIAIVGESGSGKSSLLKVVASLNAPSEGRIEVDGRPLARFGLAEYRNNIGAVFADDRLVRGSVFENVTLFDGARSAEDVAWALETVGLLDDLQALPQGLATPVSAENALLSTGQRRRLLAARALCRRPRLLLFDEITANLDPGTEEALLRSLAAVPGAKVFVTHSNAVLNHVDRVFALAEGGLHDVDIAGPLRRVA